MYDEYLNQLPDNVLVECYYEINRNTWSDNLEEAYDAYIYKEEIPKPMFINFISLEMARRWVLLYEAENAILLDDN